MNFVQQLEECLRDLSSEARKKHPGVKEASERATYKLRMLQTNYVAAVRIASSTSSSSSSSTTTTQPTATSNNNQLQQHPTTSMFQSSEILHPFLLAANYPNADYKLLEISFRAIRILMEADAIIVSDAIHIVRVYQIQAQVITSYYIKYYSKEIAMAIANANAVMSQQQQNNNQYEEGSMSQPDEDTDNNDTEGNDDEHDDSKNDISIDKSAHNQQQNTSTTSSGWFGWGSSSTNTNTNYQGVQQQQQQNTASNIKPQQQATTTPTKRRFTSPITTIKNAVSSSGGQTGHQVSLSSYPQMEKLALEILSSLLQLIQLLRSYPPIALTEEIWTYSISLSCLWYSLLPTHTYVSRTSNTMQSNTVQQAAHSTVHQLISILYQANTYPVSNNDINHKFIQRTWEDLLALTAGNDQQHNRGGISSVKLTGAFQLCQKRTSGNRVTTNNTSTALPPSPELALEIMTQVWKESSFIIKNHDYDHYYEELLIKTMGVTMTLLQKLIKNYTSVDKSLRTTQWTLALLQSHSYQYPNECRELFIHMIHKLIPLTTTACRKHHDFEDGYIFTPEEAFIFNADRGITSVNNSFTSMGITGGDSTAIVSKDQSSRNNRTSNIMNQTLGSCFPIPLLWKAGFVLELTYHILDKENLGVQDDHELEFLFVTNDNDDNSNHQGGIKSTLQALTEALSDFATVGSSCRDHIIQVVEFCYKRSSSSYKPKIFRTAEQLIAAGNSFSINNDTNHQGGDHNNDTTTITTISKPIQLKNRSTSTTNYSSNAISPILGESIWISLQIILRIGECLIHNQLVLKNSKQIFNDIFPSSLSLYQHFLKRFIACEEIVLLTLKGYMTLSDICLPMIITITNNNDNDQQKEDCFAQRRVILSSLSKLALPSWGKHDTSCQLQDHHVLSLLCLLRIVHTHYDQIGSDYDVILKTFEELSMLPIASQQLSDEIYHASLALANAFSRFAGLSTCLSLKSLQYMTTTLTNICESILKDRDIVGDSDTVLPERYTMHSPAIMSESVQYPGDGTRESSSLGGKILSIGVRAFYGTNQNGSSDGDEVERPTEFTKGERTKNVYYEDYRNDFIQRITMSNTPVRINSFGRIPFSLILLADIVVANSFRRDECGEMFTSDFFQLTSSSPVIRTFVVDVMTVQIMSQLSNEQQDQSLNGSGRIVFEDPMYSQLLAVEYETRSNLRQQERHTSQLEVLTPLCKTILATKNASVARSAVGVLSSVLEGTGETLEGEVWSLVIDAIASLSGGSNKHADRITPEWTVCCQIGFKSLKLIVDDFLEHLPSSASSNSTTTHISLLECCSSFVQSRHDINTSLTAIGLLWTIADQDSESSSIDRALSTLVRLSSDDRTEVRNAAVNTLFSCIAGRGSSFSISFWKICITDAILRVYVIVTEKSRAGVPPVTEPALKSPSSRYKVTSHHSRDSVGKMWVVTQVLVLRGLARVLRTFFPILLESISSSETSGDPDMWFQEAWVNIIDFAFDAAGQAQGRENVDIRSIGVELLVVCCQLSSKSGISAAMSPAKVSTNMEVVNGALRDVQKNKVVKAHIERTYSSSTEIWREKLFLEAFESLECFDEDILKKRTNPDDIDIQVLHKFCSHLSKLFECSKDHELKTDNPSRILRLIGGVKIDDELRQDLEGRFVLLVRSVLNAVTTDVKARFLNQCQRCAIDLLQYMAKEGSCAAFDQLISLGDIAFFVKKEESGSTSDVNSNDLPSLLSLEAATAVSNEIVKSGQAIECKMYVLHKTILCFLKEFHVDPLLIDPKKDLRRRRYYEIFIPIIESGLESVTEFQTIDDKVKNENTIQLIWDNLCVSLKDMIAPIHIGKEDSTEISCVPEILIIMKSLISTAPKKYRIEIGSIVSLGAKSALDIAKQHAVKTTTNDTERKSTKKHRDDHIKLFDSCFAGACSLNSDDPNLRECATIALHGAISDESADDPCYKVSLEASLLVCRCIRTEQNVDLIIIGIFPILCQILASTSSNDNNNYVELKECVKNLFVDANISSILEKAQHRYVEAEQRAVDMEKHVHDLEVAVQNLQHQKELLQMEITTFKLNENI